MFKALHFKNNFFYVWNCLSNKPDFFLMLRSKKAVGNKVLYHGNKTDITKILSIIPCNEKKKEKKRETFFIIVENLFIH